MAQSSKSQSFITLIMGLRILSATVNTLNGKLQNQQYVMEGGVSKYFYHPCLQSLILYISLLFYVPVFYLMKKIKRRDRLQDLQIQNKGPIFKKLNTLRILVGSTCDTLVTLMQGTALNFVPASQYQMMRAGTIAATFLFSCLCSQNKIKRQHIIGVAFVILGIMVIGSNSLLYSFSSNQSRNLEVAGYLLLLISIFLSGFAHAYHEKLLHTYAVEPIQVIGYSGIFGVILNGVITAAATFTYCPFSTNSCVYDSSASPFLERPEMYFNQLSDSSLLLVFCSVDIILTFATNIFEDSVTKYINTTTRAMCDAARSILVWSAGIIITVTAGINQANYQWERTQVGAILIQAFGFLLLMGGNLISGEVVTLLYIRNEEVVHNQDRISDSQLLTFN